MFRRRVIWRNNHAYGERLRRTFDKRAKSDEPRPGNARRFF